LQSPSEAAVAGRLLVDLDSQPPLAPPTSSFDISVVTLDKDLMQLISPHTCLIHPSALSQAGADKTKQTQIDRKSQEFKQLFTVDVPMDAELASQGTSPTVPLSAVNIDPSFVTTAQHVQQKFGCRPDQIVDFLALVGDSSGTLP
jgi:5'-3' exonuclease